MSVYFECNSFADAYAQLLYTVMTDPDAVCKPRGMEVKELIAPTIRVLNPLDRWYQSAARSTPMRYAAGEYLWYFSLRNDAAFISKYSAFWNGIKNTSSNGPMIEGRVNSSYGQLLIDPSLADASWNGKSITQWEWAIESMVKDNDTRQAIVHLNRPFHQVDWIRDFPCTLSFQFLLRDEKLNMVVHMRSNDLVMGLTFDFPMFTIFQEQFLSDIRARGVRASLGHLTLMSGSSHIYENKYEMVNSMLSGGIESMGPISSIAPPITSLSPIAWSEQFLALMRYAETGDKEKLAQIELDPVHAAFATALE